MNNKKFKMFRIVLITLSILSLIFIEIYQRRLVKEEQRIIEEKKNEITESTIIEASKLYINNNQDYFSELLKNESLEVRINTDNLVKSKLIKNNDNYKGFVKIVNGEYSLVKRANMLVDKLDSNEYITNSNNEKEAYDLKYIYNGEDPNNYIKDNNRLYRIIGITNSNDLKIISTENNIEEEWGLSGDINYLKTDDSLEEDGYKGIFYVGYVRSETKDLTSIIKNEKRNNTYTVGNPKYVGLYSYVNISDIVNASKDCKYNSILGIKKENCDSYLINMLTNTYTSNTLENNMVYKINDKGNIISSKLEKNINIKKVFYLSGLEEYKSGNGTKENPYELK